MSCCGGILECFLVVLGRRVGIEDRAQLLERGQLGSEQLVLLLAEDGVAWRISIRSFPPKQITHGNGSNPGIGDASSRRCLSLGRTVGTVMGSANQIRARPRDEPDRVLRILVEPRLGWQKTASNFEDGRLSRRETRSSALSTSLSGISPIRTSGTGLALFSWISSIGKGTPDKCGFQPRDIDEGRPFSHLLTERGSFRAVSSGQESRTRDGPR